MFHKLVFIAPGEYDSFAYDSEFDPAMLLLLILVRGLSGVRFGMITDRHRTTRSQLTNNHKHYNFREAQEIKILLGNNHVGIQGTRSLGCLPLSIK